MGELAQTQHRRGRGRLDRRVHLRQGKRPLGDDGNQFPIPAPAPAEETDGNLFPIPAPAPADETPVASNVEADDPSAAVQTPVITNVTAGTPGEGETGESGPEEEGGQTTGAAEGETTEDTPFPEDLSANETSSHDKNEGTPADGSCPKETCDFLRVCDKIQRLSQGGDDEACVAARSQDCDATVCSKGDPSSGAGASAGQKALVSHAKGATAEIILNQSFFGGMAGEGSIQGSSQPAAAAAAAEEGPGGASTSNRRDLQPTASATGGSLRLGANLGVAGVNANDGSMIPGVDQMGMGYDVITGEFRLPMFEWPKVSKANNRPPLNGGLVPDAVSASVSHAGKRTVGPTVFGSQAQYSRFLANRMGLAQPEGVFTMSEGAHLMRSISLYSDLTVKQVDYSLYKLSVFPDAEESTLQKGGHSYGLSPNILAALKQLPDCYMADCLVASDNDFGPTDKGCRESSSQGIFMPHLTSSVTTLPPQCTAWATTESGKKGNTKCTSKFFQEFSQNLHTDASKTFKICNGLKVGTSAADPTRDCILFGHDEGNICNMHDLQRIAAFVQKWGTHIVMGGEFGGSFSQLVQTKKDSPWQESVVGQEHVFNFPGANLAGLEANAALRGLAYSNPSFPDSFPFNSSGTIATTELRHSIEERAGLEHMGIQNIRYAFTGGKDIPVSTEKIFVEDMHKWIATLEEAPAILPHTMKLVAISHLLAHASPFGNETAVDGGVPMGDAERLRKQVLLDNFVKYTMVKSSNLATIMDRASTIHSQQLFQMARMHGSVHDTVTRLEAIESQQNQFIEDGRNSNSDEEHNREMARGVINWQQASQRYIGLCRATCETDYSVHLRKALMSGDFELPQSWRYFPPPPTMSSNNALKGLFDILRVDRNSCYATCTNDVTLARQSHEPQGYVGRSQEMVHQFFALLKGGCLICRGLLQNLVRAAVVGNGRMSTSAATYCQNTVWASWSDEYFKQQVFDVTQPFAFSRLNTQKEGPREYDYANRFCLGLVKEIHGPIKAWIKKNGMQQLASDPTLYETMQVLALSMEGSSEGIAEKMCSQYAGCSANGPGPVDRKIVESTAAKASLANDMEQQQGNLQALKSFLASPGLSAGAKGSGQRQAADITAKIATDKTQIAVLDKDLVALAKQKSATAAVKKTVDAQCLFECYKMTKWGAAFPKQRVDNGLQDPIPASQLAALRATEPCGYPIVIKKDKAKCQKCSALSCLVTARLKCYSYSCTSPYVTTKGIAFYVPKTVLI